MTARTMARPTNVRTRPPPLPPEAACEWSTDGRLRGVDSLLEAARTGGAASSMPAQAARKAVVRVGNIERERPGGGRWVAGVIGGRRPGLESNCARTP